MRETIPRTIMAISQIIVWTTVDFLRFGLLDQIKQISALLKAFVGSDSDYLPEFYIISATALSSCEIIVSLTIIFSLFMTVTLPRFVMR